MKTVSFLSVFACMCNVVFAQIPLNYYNSANGLSGLQLKSALHNIIKNHVEYKYTSDTTDVWDILKQTDQDTNNTDNVIEIYTGWSVNAAQEYNNGDGWEREHVWAKVHGGFGTNPPAGTDVHHLRPIDGTVNAARNSRYFANCNIPYYVNGVTPTGCYKSTTEYVWQPRDEDKGDIARMIFYMAVRYEGENGEPDLEIIDSIPANNNEPSGIMAKLSDLLQWNNDDPVDSKEKRRNNIIYNKFQRNRNPFIDNPQYANLIWNYSANIQTTEQTKIQVFPNPSSGSFYIKGAKLGDEYKIFNTLGQILVCGKIDIGGAIKAEELANGLYIIQINNCISMKIKILKN
jgi:endonuclease I